MTKIEWTKETWNPIVGCSVVSPGCTNCYAMRQALRLSKNPATPHYAGTVEMSRGGPVWTGKVALASDKVLTAPLRRRKPTMYFVNSMGDLFHEDVPDDWIDQVFAVMALAPQHTFQVLTKRAGRMREYMDAEHKVAAQMLEFCKKGQAPLPGTFRWPLPNVWLGVSAEDQARADERIPHLLATPAAIRFVSAEPLLGQVDLTRQLYEHATGLRTATPNLDWIIVGGESGKGARPMHPDWARSIRDQCAAAGVPFFFKQRGEWTWTYDRDLDDLDWRLCDMIAKDTPNGRWMNLDGGHGFHGDRVVMMQRVGKKAAGNHLDGRRHLEMPR